MSTIEELKRLASALECIVNGFLLLNANGQILYINETAAALLGVGPLPNKKADLTDLLPPRAAAVMSRIISTVLTSGQSQIETVYLEGDGLWCELRCFRHEDGVVVSLRDVTAENRDVRFHALQARVLSMIHGNASLSAVLDELVKGVGEILPDAVASVLLLDDDSVHFRHGSAPSLPEPYNQSMDGIAIGPQAGTCGAAMYHRRRVIVEDIGTDPLWENYRELALGAGLRACWSTPLFDGTDAVIGSFAVYYHIARRPSEGELELGDQVSYLASLAIQIQRQEAALRESEERFRQMDEAIDDVFWMEEIATKRLIFLSPTFAKLTGYSAKGYDQEPAKWETLVHPEDRERIEASIAESQRTWVLPAEGLRYRIIRADGEVRWVNDRAFLIRDAEGKPWRLSGLIRDITDQIALERQLRASQRMESLGQLTGGIAHDFNNLLTVILGNAELLHEGLEGQPQLLQLAQMVEMAAQSGSKLTQRLLTFARRQPLEPRVVYVNTLVDEMAPLLSRALGQQVHIRAHHQRPQPAALVDPAQLESSLLNLCLNARDAMPAGGVLTIETAAISCDHDEGHPLSDLAPGTYLRLSVSDVGVGIRAEDLERVFEPFFSTKSKGKGTGLGLAMVYGFVRQSRGLVTASSEWGKGSTFHLYLPVADAQMPPEPKERYPAVRSARGEWVLLVEDDLLVRNYVHGQLQELGYRVHAAANGDQALAILRSATPVDLLFTDVMMPDGLSGPELVSEARRIRPDLKVLYTSGYTENALEYHGALEDGVLLLNKPYRRNELASKLWHALDRD